ncbi:MAG: NUDIX domain-containing protein [Alphaproteobacteria bacterium]
MFRETVRWRPQQRVRVIAIGIARHRDSILAMRVRDDSGRVKGCRPPGGAVEFGERAVEALGREFREEFGTGITVVGAPAVIENLYTHEGAAGYEIVFAFPIRLDPGWLQDQDEIRVDEGGNSGPVCAWYPIEALVRGAIELYPDGMRDLLPHLLPD